VPRPPGLRRPSPTTRMPHSKPADRPVRTRHARGRPSEIDMAASYTVQPEFERLSAA
jgi:hypothetical protein